MIEAVQTYVNLVNGVSRAARDRARAAAREWLAQVGLEEVADDAERRVGRLTEEILDASRANRELLENLVASEVTKAASRLGFVRSDDLDEVREEIAELRAQLARDKAAAAGAPRARNASARGAAASAAAATPPAASDPAATAATTPAPKKAAATKTTTAKKAAAAGTPAPTSPGTPRAGRATSTRPGAAQRLAEQAGTGGAGPATDAGAEAGA
ncbi:hypothetical protein SAMN04488543_1404 [Friedmanniella luteola]|uniref:Polyhydroxyalkanoate synthesis regulator phasin n=1 Tax=Friedmanniella luteola TaxID=546871 RepID=A0A1H1QU78_9ACTN|nr:hypothetical protein [Friedmanniella luteola]SDS26980.1 hypothetical protein SAMN04488543_1404 [Friedmanniella luteola]